MRGFLASLPDGFLRIPPTFICVVRTHILDGAHGAEDGLRMLAARWLSRNSPSAPMETPTADRDRRVEVAK
jgi:hypothetical protein